MELTKWLGEWNLKFIAEWNISWLKKTEFGEWK